MKWRAHPADVLPLWVAEMDVHLAPTVAEAIHRAVDAGDTGYPHGKATRRQSANSPRSAGGGTFR